VFNLAQLSEFYKPKTIPKGFLFKEIHLKSEYVTYCHADDGDENRSFALLLPGFARCLRKFI